MKFCKCSIIIENIYYFDEVIHDYFMKILIILKGQSGKYENDLESVT